MIFTQLITLSYSCIFIILAFKGRQINWLMATLFLIAGFSYVIRFHIPYFWNIDLMLYHPYFYITLSSFFFFINDWKYSSEDKMFYIAKPNIPIGYWAVTAFLQHLAYLIILLISQLSYPKGNSLFTLISILQMYLLHPVWWITIHIILMTSLYLISIKKNEKHYFSIIHLQAIFLMMLVFLMSYIYYQELRFILTWS
ncbi:MAG: hypothetical protein IKI22_00725 [Neisseriaceae bacterium]|nr:hypothetical protein [Neisseriaceae bacterium]